jgi:hypothetical protein
MLLPLAESAPVIQTINVHSSTPRKIAAGKAAEQLRKLEEQAGR